MLPAVDFNVSATGDFKGVTHSKALSTRLTAKADELIRAGAPSGDPGRSATQDAIETTAIMLSPGMLEAAAAEDYQLETAMWIGATLEQGVWYETSAPLSLPGLSRVALQQRIEFAFTRRVPCTAGAAASSCVEIVIHATPDKEAVGDLLADITDPYPDTQFANYDASIAVRLVVDPATLLPYGREEQIYWYASFGKDPGDTVLESDRIVSDSRYVAQ